ncbi:MAG: TolC family protein [Bacteroidota bacterium]|nr:TolC family protein [Bacteroidota bacterium]
MKYSIFIGIGLILFSAHAQTKQTLSIEECYQLAQKNYPLVKQRELILKSREYSVENASKGYFPQMSINGFATYQSDVTHVPMKVPGFSIPELSKDQYKIYAELNQTIFDAGFIKMHKQTLGANTEVEAQKLEIELYKLKDRINQLFFGILLVNEQLVQTEIFKKDIGLALSKTTSAIKNGVALKSNGEILQAELLKANQRTIELKAARNAFIDMLELFTNLSINENVQLIKPIDVIFNADINRPEMILFDRQKKLIDVQSSYLFHKNLPKLSLFAQGGYGRPAIDMLNNNFDTYYIGGARLSWPLSGFYTFKKDKALQEINRNLLDIQKETFLFNTNHTLKQQNAESLKLMELIKTDNELIVLRQNIKNTAMIQFENGVLSASDYLRELNAEDQAKQNKLVHEIQLLIAHYNIQTTTGN